MRLFRSLSIGLAALALAGAALAQTSVSGVRFDESLDVAGSKLVLNGAGTRYRAIVKVYAAGLYVGKKVATPEEALAAPGAKRVRIVMLREVDTAELGKLFTRSVEDNMERAAFAKLVPGLIRMGQIFADHKRLLPGEQFTIDWVPNTGTVITVKGQPQGEPFKEPEFFNAMLRIWLGPKPADSNLKLALLGKQPETSVPGQN